MNRYSVLGCIGLTLFVAAVVTLTLASVIGVRAPVPDCNTSEECYLNVTCLAGTCQCTGERTFQCRPDHTQWAEPFAVAGTVLIWSTIVVLVGLCFALYKNNK